MTLNYIKPYSRTLEEVIRMKNPISTPSMMIDALTHNDAALIFRYRLTTDFSLNQSSTDELLMFFMFICLAEGRSFDPPERGPSKKKINRDTQTGELL